MVQVDKSCCKESNSSLFGDKFLWSPQLTVTQFGNLKQTLHFTKPTTEYLPRLLNSTFAFQVASCSNSGDLVSRKGDAFHPRSGPRVYLYKAQKHPVPKNVGEIDENSQNRLDWTVNRQWTIDRTEYSVWLFFPNVTRGCVWCNWIFIVARPQWDYDNLRLIFFCNNTGVRFDGLLGGCKSHLGVK